MIPIGNTATSKTDELIRSMAMEAGLGRAHAGMWFERRLALAAAAALVIGAGLAILLFGIAPALAAAPPGALFWHKAVCGLSLAAGSFLLVRSLARPDGSGWPAAALLPGAALLAFGGVTDQSGFPVMGQSDQSVPVCLGAIVLLSLPGLALILGVLRTGAPTRPALAGTAAGLMSGALGAAAYAVSCKNDGGQFVAIWYSAAIVIAGVVGTVAGRRVLMW
jgi:hypothetical protein